MKNLFAWLLGGKRAEADASALPRPPGPIPDLQLKLTQLALEIARGCGKKLDFSHDSIKVVESILSDLHLEYERTKSDEGLNGIALEFGGYIATTIQRNLGEGVLERDHPDFGEASFPFNYSGGTIFPCAWCFRRILDGEGDNVWVKYQLLVLEPISKRE